MIQRRRTPDGRNLDIDHGPGPAWVSRGFLSGAVGAVHLTEAIEPNFKRGDINAIDDARTQASPKRQFNT